ncbi:MAG: branched-chain amino acid ABC transporter permease [Burkholderiaceae bacterium]|jgi:branched-chain amino acid transport system permease protein|nr:branched-chain amino acid ABC transporter permease [Burkholderiaceae bacterium]
MKKSSLILYGVLLIALIIAPWIGVYPVFMMTVLCFALFASAFNLLLGYTGLLSFGHAAFFGFSAYACAYVTRDLGLTPEFGLIAGLLTGALLGWIFGVLAIRRLGIYFAMITLGLAEMVHYFCLQAPFTGGEDGMQGIARGKLLGLLSLDDDRVMYYFTLLVAAAAFALIVRTIHSPFGQVLKGIKENEPRTLSLGYDVNRFKLLAFVISAALTGLAGALKAQVIHVASLTDVNWPTSGLVILMVLLGGVGTLSGPMIGAALVVGLENKIGDLGNLLARLSGIDWFNTLGDNVPIVTGLIFVVCVLAFRRGIMGEAIALFERRPPRR